MSRKLNDNQVMAIHLIASGQKSCEIAKQLNIRPETLSRWKQNPQFKKAVNDTTEIILKEILENYKHIIILSQKVIEDLLLDEEINLINKTNVALKFLNLMKGKDDINEKSRWRLSRYQNDKLLNFDEDSF